jgi:methionyl-tRNA synthetase
MGALKKIDNYCVELNKFIAEKQPWTLAKEGKNEELTDVLVYVYNGLLILPDLLQPFIPETSARMGQQLETLQPEVLFPRIES